MRHHDRELQTDPSSGTSVRSNNLEQQDVYGGEKLEKTAVS